MVDGAERRIGAAEEAYTEEQKEHELLHFVHTRVGAVFGQSRQTVLLVVWAL